MNTCKGLSLSGATGVGEDKNEQKKEGSVFCKGSVLACVNEVGNTEGKLIWREICSRKKGGHRGNRVHRGKSALQCCKLC